MENRQIKRALISVYHKEGIDVIAKKLHSLGAEILSTGGTASFIQELGIPVTTVEEVTSYPSILGGRVKTLHPKVFGGILSRRDNSSDNESVKEYGIPLTDLVIVDLYPFEQYVSEGASHQEIIEKIDIGGISLIRAAAKNYKDVLIVSCKEQYERLTDILDKGNGTVTQQERLEFAGEAFNVSSHYDTAIFKYFSKENPFDSFKESIRESTPLRYGENPHQKALFYGKEGSLPTQIHGKEISYNNLLDIEAAIELISDFDETALAILKHNNACGCAVRNTIKEAWEAALAADPVSAFGGVIAANREIDEAAASEINKIFFEVVIAPSYSQKALEILKQKKNRIILLSNKDYTTNIKFRSMLGGVLMQERDTATELPEDLKVATKESPSDSQVKDLIFANKLVKHSKSNAIVLAKDNALVASGIGQTSRVDALKQAITKAKSFEIPLEGAVMASDAFFPFPDCVEIAHKEGISSVIQPGGSIRDNESIEYCNQHNLSMVMTGQRHFKH